MWLTFFQNFFQLFDFELSADEMKQLKALDKGPSGRTFIMSLPG